MNKILLSILSFFSFFALWAAEPNEFRYFQLLEPPATVDPNRLNSVELTPEVLSKLDYFDDLRLFDTEGRELPFKREIRFHQAESTQITPVSGRLKSFDRNGSQATLAVTVEPDENGNFPECNRLTIRTGEQNFEKNVAIYGRTGDDWLLLAGNQMFFDHSPRVALTNRSFEFPIDRYRELRIVIDNYDEDYISPLRKVTTGETPDSRKEEKELFRRELKVDGIGLSRKTRLLIPSQVLEREYPLRNLTLETDQVNKTSILTFEAGKLPISRLEIQTASTNFSRQLTFEELEPRRSVGARIEDLSLPDLSRRQTSFSIPQEWRPGRCRVVIANNDNPPLEELSLKAFGPAYRLVLLSRDVPARLSYDSGGRPAGDYDLDRTLAGLNLEARAGNDFRPGPPQNNPDFREPFKLNGKPFFLAAVIIMALGLVFFIGRNFRKIEKEIPAE